MTLSKKQLQALIDKKSFDAIVKTKQKNNEIIITDKITIHTTKRAENNKANDEIERFLSKITEKQAKIIKGKKSNKKTIILK